MGDITLFEKLFGRRPDVSHLRVFGCLCFVHVYSDSSNKLDNQSIRCIFLGYDEARKGWEVY